MYYWLRSRNLETEISGILTICATIFVKQQKEEILLCMCFFCYRVSLTIPKATTNKKNKVVVSKLHANIHCIRKTRRVMFFFLFATKVLVYIANTYDNILILFAKLMQMT